MLTADSRLLPRLLLPLALASACGGGGDGRKDLAPTDPAALRQTLEDLAAFGEKRVGTEAGAMAGDYVMQRMTDAGLENVHFESFGVPMWVLDSTSLSVSADGVALSPAIDHEVFYSSGVGSVVDAEVVFVNIAKETDLSGVDVTGKIALVRRSTSFHRSSQARNVAAAGAAAMLYTSTAPDNLRQVGTVSLAWEPMVPIPTVSIGADDGARILAALDAGQTVTASVDVQAHLDSGTGRNVVGVLPGKSPEQIVIGAHYDTWFQGSADNGSGTTAVIALADRAVRRGKPDYTLVFVAYDGEEVALYGGYDYLRKHHFVTQDPILAFINFEMPSVKNGTLLGLGRSRQPVLDDGLRFAGLDYLYPFFVTLDVVPDLFGGVIPTDIQGAYRAGVPTVTTATDTPYYHTTGDTPDNVDTAFLAESVDDFLTSTELLGESPPEAFDAVDDTLWQADAVPAPRTTGQPLSVAVTVTDSTGAPMANANVIGDLLVDDFSFAGRTTTTTGADGTATLVIPAEQADSGAGDRYLHVTAGEEYPLVETIVVLD